MTVINYETGEISDSTDLVPVENVAALNTLDPAAREVAVTQMLSEARSWLAHAVEATEPKSVAHFKAFIATVAESTKQLNLSKEIQLDAQEMVRRAERGVGKAIRTGQEEGSIATAQDAKVYAGRSRQQKDKTFSLERPTLASDFATQDDLTGNGVGIYAMTDGVSDEQFDEAVDEAKSEGNLSRANVVRKVRDVKEGGFETRKQRADKIAELADQGYSSRQMPNQVGISEESIRQIARDFNITIHADKVVGRSRRIDSNRIVDESVSALEGMLSGLAVVDVAELDQAKIAGWSTSLKESIKSLNRLVKEMNQS